MYLNQIMKGATVLILWIFVAFITPEITGTSRIFCLPFWIFAMADAYRIGKKLETGQAVKEWD